MYEVELKYWLADESSFLQQIAELGAKPVRETDQEDLYFNHPNRDFAETDEAVRLRRDGAKTCITYKGPKIDAETKTRRELEVPISEGLDISDKMADIFRALGFRDVASVRKRRRYFELSAEGHDVEIVLDRVEHVGEFVELETQSDEAGLDVARNFLLELSRRLNLEKTERRSYLQLVLEATGKR